MGGHVALAESKAPERIRQTSTANRRAVHVDGLTKTYRRKGVAVNALDNIDLAVEEGEMLVLLGPSGCGKTTLLRSLVGLERPTSGRIQLGGSTVFDADSRSFVPPNKRDVAMVFQHYALWPHMSVAANVAYPLKSRRMKSSIDEGRVEEVLKAVQCDHLADRFPPELSGGQQQRVSLARALAPRPSLLLLDEPLSNLDALLRIDLRSQLRLLHRELGFTGVYVTHDQDEAMSLGTRVAVMNSGRFEQIGEPHDVYHRPATEYVANFLGARNAIEVEVGADGVLAVLGSEYREIVRDSLRGSYTLRWRDSHLAIRPAQGAGATRGVIWTTGATILETLSTGDATEHLVDFAGTRFYVSTPGDIPVARAGDAIDLGFEPGKTLCYGPDGRLVADWAKC